MDTHGRTVVRSGMFRVEITRPLSAEGLDAILDEVGRHFVDDVEVTLDDFVKALAASHDAPDQPDPTSTSSQLSA